MNRRQFHTIRKIIECHRSIRLFNKQVYWFIPENKTKKVHSNSSLYLPLYIHTKTKMNRLICCPKTFWQLYFNLNLCTFSTKNLWKTLIINIQLKMPKNKIGETLGKKEQSQLYLIRVEREPPCYCRTELEW